MHDTLLLEQEGKDLFNKKTIKQNKQLLKKGDERLTYIIKTIGNIVGRDLLNIDNTTTGPNGDSDPIKVYLDADSFDNDITFQAKFIAIKNRNFTKYDEHFPTSWLWTNFEEQLTEEVKLYEVQLQVKEQQIQDEKTKITNDLKKIKTDVDSKIPDSMKNSFVFKSVDQLHNELEDSKKIPTPLEEITKRLEEQKEYLKGALTPEEFQTIQFKTPNMLLFEMKMTEKVKKIK